ncbi:MAG: extracellular solute-binding protein [Planctomycetota bacterium]|nr:extracellular solute-binding protein [Planctomycetota bacterium]
MPRQSATARIISLSLVGVAVATVLLLVRPPDLSLQGRRLVVTIWHPWGGATLETFQNSVNVFEKSHPDLACKTLYVPNDLSASQKFFTSVIGDCAPDVIFVDGPQVAEWAHRGLLLPLDDLLAAEGVDVAGLKNDFFAPCWEQGLYRGKVYAITYSADPNFCFVWNKKMIRQAIERGEIPAGALDVDKPPATLAQLDRWNALVTRRVKTATGDRLERIGLVPWGVYGNANSIFTWGWAFGGQFYDPATGKVTADDPRIVEALEWMVRHAREYDYERISNLASTFQSEARNPFFLGQQMLNLAHMSMIADIDRFASEGEGKLEYGRDYGVCPIPQGPGGLNAAAWVGGWTMAIPATITDPARRRAALRYILWNCRQPEGTTLAARTNRCFPAWKDAPFFPEAAKDPRLAQFIDILRSSRHQRPVMPAQAFYMDQLGRAVDKAIRGELTPAQALGRASRATQERLDEVLAEQGGQP